MRGRGDDDRHIIKARFTAALFDEGPTVHHRHHQIQNDQVGTLFAYGVERFGAVAGLTHLIAVVA